MTTLPEGGGARFALVAEIAAGDEQLVRDRSGVIRRATPDDFEIVRELRLQALRDAPAAFASSYEREAGFDVARWRRRLRPDRNPTFVWEDERTALGLVVGALDDEPAVAHLFAMWVRPAARGTGVADRLVVQVIEWARAQSAEVVRLHITDGNETAERLYARHGFSRTGRVEVRDDGLVEIEMEATLAPIP